MQALPVQMKFLIGALGLLLLLEVIPVFFGDPFQEWQLRESESQEAQETAKLSDFNGEAAIGEAAVMVSQEDGVIQEMLLCATALPEGAFVLLFVAYVVLLAFNLRASYQAKGYPGGIFEVVLSLAFLGIWGYFDQCAAAPWLPLLLVKTGLILYILAVVALPYARREKEPQDATLF